jgi:HAD superfamily phosphatase
MDKAIIVFDIDGVIRDVGGSYRRAIADTVNHFTEGAYIPSMADIDELKSEGIWNNDWQASEELIYRYFLSQGKQRDDLALDYQAVIQFFQRCYRGPDRETWTGYIQDETLLVEPAYFTDLTNHGCAWGFFSGAMRDEANFVLVGKLNLIDPVLIAMEDAPGKPDPSGLFQVVSQLEKINNLPNTTPVIYVGDTVADMLTIQKAKVLAPERTWLAIGILPPHMQNYAGNSKEYQSKLEKAGASLVFPNVRNINYEVIKNL